MGILEPALYQYWPSGGSSTAINEEDDVADHDQDDHEQMPHELRSHPLHCCSR